MKYKQLTIVLPLITCFLCTGCNLINNKNSDDDLVLPGKDRIWWTEGFNDLNEASKFLVDLRNTQKNGNFNFGLSSFIIPKKYICRSTGFYGHIDGNFSNKEDIFNSTYDYFWIKQ